jgi:hypothetical protein
MNVEFTNNFQQCVYDKDTCMRIKLRAEIGDAADADTSTYYAIWGNDVPSDIEIIGKCNDCTAYVFHRHENGKYVPVRATYSAKTLANFARAERKFGHLRPENEAW